MRARALLSRSLVWDNHAGVTYDAHDQSLLPQLRRYKDAGFDVVFLNVGFGEQGVEAHVRMLASFRQWLSLRPDDYLVVETADDIDRARATGRLAVGFDIEGGNAVADQPSLVQLYYDLGVRWMLLAYNKNSALAGGCQDDDIGLTALGRQVIDEMERVGMLVCCAHTGERSVRDIFDHATKPVIFSHANPHRVHAHPRNVSDELLRACAATGGVVGINGIGIFLGENDISPEAFARHLDYAVQLIGPDHVSIALDYFIDEEATRAYVRSRRAMFPASLGDDDIKMAPPEFIEPYVEQLIGMGYKDADLQAILGGNLLRLAHRVWKPVTGRFPTAA